MTDSLTVFGTDYTNVTGIKATGTGNGTLTYIRPTGTKSISANGTGIDVAAYATVDVSVSGGTASLQAKTNISPTTSSQTITPDTGYDGLSSVQINAMPSGTAGAPTATKGTVSNHAISVTPSVTNTTGYITGGTKTGTAVSVSASELVSGTLSITENDTGIDVSNYASVNVAVPDSALTVTLSYNEQTEMWEPDRTYAEVLAAVNAGKDIFIWSGDDTLSDIADGSWDFMNERLTYYVYRSDGNSTIVQGVYYLGSDGAHRYYEDHYLAPSGTKSITENGSSIDVAEYQYANVNVPTGTARSSSDLTVSGATVTVPAGLYSTQATKSVANGSATTPATSITANPSISVSSGGLITASASATKSVTPTVSAGYVSSGTAGTITVSGSNTSQLTTQAGSTTTPTTSQQTIVSSGTYVTGDIKVAAMPSGSAGTPSASKGAVSNHQVSVTPSVTNSTGYITGGTKTGTAVTVTASELASGNLALTANTNSTSCVGYSTVSVAVPIVTYYTSSSNPTSSQGSNGDIWLVTS